MKTRSQESGVRRQKLTLTAISLEKSLQKEQRRAVKSLIEDSGYTRAEAIAIVLAGGLE